ncbi:hypothetical protein L1887_32527 [Cichorium endivia]|nr:hypothetical protein L1887_32527 [Cichorium endivia]
MDAIRASPNWSNETADFDPMVKIELEAAEAVVGLADFSANIRDHRPVLLCMHIENLEEAIAIVNRNRYGFGDSIFTENGASSRKFQTEIEAGQGNSFIYIRSLNGDSWKDFRNSD